MFYIRFPMNLAVTIDLIHRIREDGRVAVMLALQSETAEARAALTSASRESVGDIECIDADDLYAVKFDLLLSPIWEPGIHHLPRLRRTQPLRRLVGLGRFRAVQLFHGLADKKGAGVGNMTLAEPFDDLFLLNPIAFRLYEKLGMPAERLHLIGFCKVDRLARGEIDPQPLRRCLGLPEGPVVLYAPTWEFVNDDPALLAGVVEELARCCATVVVKLHDLTIRRYSGTDVLTNLMERFPTVRFPVAASSNEYLALADLLISDMSSIAFEYLVRDRPVLFIETPAMIERFGTEGIESTMRWCGEIVRSVGDLRTVVERSLARPEAMSAQRTAVLSEVLFRPGHAIDRATSTIYRLLGLDA